MKDSNTVSGNTASHILNVTYDWDSLNGEALCRIYNAVQEMEGQDMAMADVIQPETIESSFNPRDVLADRPQPEDQGDLANARRILIAEQAAALLEFTLADLQAAGNFQNAERQRHTANEATILEAIQRIRARFKK